MSERNQNTAPEVEAPASRSGPWLVVSNETRIRDGQVEFLSSFKGFSDYADALKAAARLQEAGIDASVVEGSNEVHS